MFAPAPFANIWLYPKPADMRCSFNGLIGLVKSMAYHPLSGDYFVFINRRRTQLKILYFEPDGYAIWVKRLEQGQWAYPSKKPLGARSRSASHRETEINSETIALSATDLSLILSGLKVEKARQHKRFNGQRHTTK